MLIGEAFPVDQEKCDDSIIDLTESFNSSCCLEELEEGEIKSPVKLIKNRSSWSKSRSSFQLNSESRKLTKIISAPNLTAKTVESVLKEKSLNIATLLKANQSKCKVTFIIWIQILNYPLSNFWVISNDLAI